jgi:hypothetical protein
LACSGLLRNYPDDVEVPSFVGKVICAKCGARGRLIDERPNWKEQPALFGSAPAYLRCIMGNVF